MTKIWLAFMISTFCLLVLSCSHGKPTTTCADLCGKNFPFETNDGVCHCEIKRVFPW